MANFCNFDMKIRGKKENIEKLKQYLQSNYHYTYYEDYINATWVDKKRFPKNHYVSKDGKRVLRSDAEHHFWRVFECNELDLYEEDNTWSMQLYGYCAWSVSACMLAYSGNGYCNTGDEFEKEHGYSLERASDELNLDIEVYSTEPGCCFAEHYLIKNGEVERNECFDYIEYPIFNYKKKEDAENDLGVSITDKEWNEQEWIVRCESQDVLELAWNI